MSRYRKVEVQTWSDKNFSELSPLLPSGQALWLYLLTGPRTCILPGVIAAGRAAMAEELDWPQEAFDKAFGEACEKGMVKGDWKARLVWLPNALRETNKPESANVAVAWRREWDHLPECALKADIYQAVCAFLGSLGGSYLAAFTGDRATAKSTEKTTEKPSVKPSGKASPKTSPNQEQQQEQQQQQEQHTDARAPLRPALVARRRLHCAWESAIGLDVPHELHREFVRRFMAAGYGEASADGTLFAWYAEVEREWSKPGTVIGDSSYPFWRARFREVHGTTVAPPPSAHDSSRQAVSGRVPAPATWADPARAWRCHHRVDVCQSRTACELRTAREVGEGHVRLEDVPLPIRKAVTAMAPAYSSEAVHA